MLCAQGSSVKDVRLDWYYGRGHLPEKENKLCPNPCSSVCLSARLCLPLHVCRSVCGYGQPCRNECDDCRDRSILELLSLSTFTKQPLSHCNQYECLYSCCYSHYDNYRFCVATVATVVETFIFIIATVVTEIL